MTSRWKKPSLRSPRVAGVGVVTALVAGTLGLAFGTGYVANEAVFSGTSAWLRSDDDQATLVSAAGGAPQDQVETGAGDVTTNPDGSLGFTSEPDDDGTRRVERHESTPGADDDPAPTGRATIAARATTVVADDHTWVVDPEAGTISKRDPRTLAASGAPLRVDGGLVGHALGTDGTLWVLDGEGRVARVDGRRLTDRRSLDLDAPAEARLAVAGEQPVVVDPGGGRLLVVGGETVPVPALRGADVLLAPSQPGPWLVLVAGTGDRHRLVALDPTTGAADTTDLGADPVAAPLAVAADAYVPTVADGRQLLRRFALPGLAEARPVRLPATTDRGHRPADDDLGYDAFLVGNRIWANDPVSTQALTIGEQEEPTFVQKVDPDATGDDGDAVTDEEAEEPEAPSAPQTPVTTPALPPVPTPPARPPAGSGPEGPGGGTRAPTTAPATTAGAGSITTTTEAEAPPVPVPDVVGLDRTEACARIVAAGLGCKADPVEDRDAAEDEVSAQEPAGGSVPLGTPVTITYAVWGRVTVPEDLAGTDHRQAAADLEALGLRVDSRPRTDGSPTDVIDQVEAGSIDPAPGSTVKVNATVTFTYVSDYTDITFDPNTLTDGNAQQACEELAALSLDNCAPAIGDAAPTRADSDRVYAAVGPEGRTTVDPREPVTVTAYATYLTKTFPLPGFPTCVEAQAWLDANVPGSSCTPDRNGQVGGPTPPGTRLGQTPAQDSVVAEDAPFAMTVITYEPPLVTLIDWSIRNTAIHTLRPQDSGAPGTGGGDTSPNDWVEGDPRGVFFATEQPGTVPVLCAILRNGLRDVHHCGTAPPPAPGEGTWETTYGGQPMAWAYPGDAGFGVRQKTCVLYRPDGGRNKVVGQYHTAAERPCATNTSGGDFYVDGEFFTTPG